PDLRHHDAGGANLSGGLPAIQVRVRRGDGRRVDAGLAGPLGDLHPHAAARGADVDRVGAGGAAMTGRRGWSVGAAVRMILLALALVWTLFPVYWMLVTAFKTTLEIFSLRLQLVPA